MRLPSLPLLALLLCACAPSGTGRMVAERVPQGWQDELLEDRAAKDTLFREDPETPLMPEDVPSFEGLEYFPPDPRFRFVGPVQFYPAPEEFTILTTGGKFRPCARVGWLSFVLEGQVCVLQVYRLLDSAAEDPIRALFLPFTDLSSGEETYPAGRYVQLVQRDDGGFVLDFNRAYNPSCAYGDPSRFACPVTPPANRLPVRIEAGERGYKQAGKTEAAG